MRRKTSHRQPNSSGLLLLAVVFGLGGCSATSSPTVADSSLDQVVHLQAQLQPEAFVLASHGEAGFVGSAPRVSEACDDDTEVALWRVKAFEPLTSAIEVVRVKGRQVAAVAATGDRLAVSVVACNGDLTLSLVDTSGPGRASIGATWSGLPIGSLAFVGNELVWLNAELVDIERKTRNPIDGPIPLDAPGDLFRLSIADTADTFGCDGNSHKLKRLMIEVQGAEPVLWVDPAGNPIEGFGLWTGGVKFTSEGRFAVMDITCGGLNQVSVGSMDPQTGELLTFEKVDFPAEVRHPTVSISGPIDISFADNGNLLAWQFPTQEGNLAPPIEIAAE